VRRQDLFLFIEPIAKAFQPLLWARPVQMNKLGA